MYICMYMYICICMYIVVNTLNLMQVPAEEKPAPCCIC